ncbi:MAG: LAGLIDADG family homing endonuclease [Candidatus Paceibacterota bacterium]
MKVVYKFAPHTHLNPKTGVHRISYHNVELSAFLKSRSLELLTIISDLPRSFQREFLRAFFDDEGCMDFRIDRNLRRVRGYQNDRKILVLIQRLLSHFGIRAILQGKNEVVISGKENLKKFQKEINFSKGVRINPKRTNSIWKKNLEKRKLLDMAITSFKH